MDNIEIERTGLTWPCKQRCPRWPRGFYQRLTSDMNCQFRFSISHFSRKPHLPKLLMSNKIRRKWLLDINCAVVDITASKRISNRMEWMFEISGEFVIGMVDNFVRELEFHCLCCNPRIARIFAIIMYNACRVRWSRWKGFISLNWIEFNFVLNCFNLINFILFHPIFFHSSMIAKVINTQILL